MMCLLVITVACTINGAHAAEKDAAMRFLEERVEASAQCIVGKGNQHVLDADVVLASLSINTGNQYNNSEIYHAYFLKHGSSYIEFASLHEMLASESFVKAFNKKFVLKSEEDGLALRSLFFQFDDESRKGFFQKDGKWYFIRSEFFDDYSGYEIMTDKKGRVTQIISHSDLKVEIPAQLMGSAANKRYKKPGSDYLSNDDIHNMESKLREKADFNFKLEAMDISPLGINLQVYDADLIVREVTEEGSVATFERPFALLLKDGEFAVVESKRKIEQHDLFAKAIKEKYVIKTEVDAQAFETFLDLLGGAEVKKHYFKEGIWYFVREESSDVPSGYMVKVDEVGNFKYWDNQEFSDKNILRFKMRDDDFEMDFAFKMVKPSGDLEITISDKIPVEITYNADMVNAVGAWIMTRSNGKMVGMEASTNMESPFIDDIPGSYLGTGTHLVEYLLLPPGQDTSKPLGHIKINVTVK